MITRDEYGRVLDYDTVRENFDALEAVEIGEIFISKESADKISDILNLSNKNTEELRAIRNAVVVLFCQRKREDSNIGEDGYAKPGMEIDYDRMMYWSTKISGITTVIDGYLWRIERSYLI